MLFSAGQLGLFLNHMPSDLAAGLSRPIHVDFVAPAWLLLIPALVAASWWIARGALGGWRGGRQTFALVLRCLLITLLCTALAEPRIHRASRDVSVVVVRDFSASIPADQQQAADDFLAASAARKRPSDLLGLVTTAKDAFVQSIPSSGEPHLDVGHIGDTTDTDLQQGIQLASAVAPPDAALRILLLSDGNQTKGNLAAAVRAAAARHIPIDVATFDYDRSGMIRIADTVAPTWARAGDTVLVRVIVDAGRPAPARLSLALNGSLLALDAESDGLSRPVDLTAGLNVYSIPVHLGDQPVQEFNAYIQPADGQSSAIDVPSLLQAQAITFTSSRGRVLVLADDRPSLSPFLDAIRTDDLSIEVRAAVSAPASPAEWAGYDAVILANQPASAFSQLQQTQLAQYVRDVGGGLVVLGGPDSYGAGGWIGSPLADALPLELDPPQKRELPKGALALIIDRSGSMSSPVGNTGMSQQQLANDAAILGVRALSRLDLVTVVAFSEDPQVIVPLTDCSNPEAIARAIRAIGSGGGTNLFPAIDAASFQLARASAGVRHVIILSDGQTTGNPADGLAKVAALKRQGVTVSTVMIGDSADDELLKRMAIAGGGRWYPVRSNGGLAQLPQIFIKEAQTVRRTLIWEGPPFTPKPSAGAETLLGLASPFPSASGYVVTGERGGLASVSLHGPSGDPLLAHWQHGLGRVTAYTSDASTRWNSAWIAWPSFNAFWKRQLSWTIRPSGDPRARISIDRDGPRPRLTLELLDETGDRANFAAVQGRVLHPSSSTSSSSSDADDLRLQQVGPGRYEADIPADQTGVHLVSLRYSLTTPTGPRQGAVRAAVIRRAGEELKRPRPDVESLWQVARQTNGRIYRISPTGADLWTRDDLVMPKSSRAIWLGVALAAIGLFLVDVAARRIAVDPARVRQALAAGLVTSRPAKPSASLTTLAAAKARASRSLQKHSKSPADGPVPKTQTPTDPASRGLVIDTPSPTASAPAPPADPAPTAPAPDADPMARLRAAKNRARPD